MRTVLQTPDGWIWISTLEGLFRFDGITFERMPLPAGSPFERASSAPMLVSRAGELWAAYSQYAGVAVYRDGSMQPVPMEDPPGVITAMVETADGSIWITLESGKFDGDRLARWKNGRWNKLDERYGLGRGELGNLCASADGTLWVPRANQQVFDLLYLRPDAEHFEVSAQRISYQASCFSDPQGQIWITDAQGTRQVARGDGQELNQPVVLPVPAKGSVGIQAVDAHGRHWGVADFLGGIYYVAGGLNPGPGGTQVAGPFRTIDGLSAAVIHTIFVDREQNVWATTDLGLDRFRGATIIHDPRMKREGAMFGLSQAGSDLYVDAASDVFRISAGTVQKVLTTDLWGECAAGSQGIWLIYPRRVTHWHDGKRRSIALPAGTNLMSNCAQDSAGRLWVADTAKQPMWLDEQGWHRPQGSAPKMEHWDVATISPSGHFIYASGSDLVQLDGDQMTVIPLAAHDPGLITSVVSAGGDLFVSSNNGLLRIRGEQVARLGWERFPWVAPAAAPAADAGRRDLDDARLLHLPRDDGRPAPGFR